MLVKILFINKNVILIEIKLYNFCFFIVINLNALILFKEIVITIFL